ncbi:hypothetical protein ABIE54_005608 [Chitinophagaceae bacterium OAS944]
MLVDYHKGKEHRTGYIHRSRIVHLKDMTAFKQIIVNDTLLKLELNDMQITIKSGTFVKAGRKISYNTPADASPFFAAIDGKMPWGTDGALPRTEYKSIQLKIGNNILTFPKSGYNDLFEIGSFHRTLAYLDKTTGKIYIEAGNSDGAGSYVVAWIINNAKIEWREEFIPF